MTILERRIAPFLEKLRALEFVRNLDYATVAEPNDIGIDGVLKIETPKGRFSFSVERRNSYLDRALLNAFMVQAKYLTQKRRPLLVFARYIPRPSAERLIQSGVNFLDRAGNMHLALGDNYVRTVIGIKEGRNAVDDKSITPAKVQLLFGFAASEEARDWTVRELAEISGMSKSNVAKLREQLLKQGILQRTGNEFQLRRDVDVEDYLVRGYEQVLRPKLLFNRFRAAEPSTELSIGKLRRFLAEHSIRWSLTGGAGAFELQPFYKGPELVLFVDKPTNHTARQLRLFPDTEGPITLLQGFGTVSYWQRKGENVIAHPWLIYSELMRSADPRAHEAADELKRGFLQS